MVPRLVRKTSLVILQEAYLALKKICKKKNVQDVIYMSNGLLVSHEKGVQHWYMGQHG